MAEQEKSASTVSSNIDKERSRKESNKPLKKEKNKVINTEFIEKVLQHRGKVSAEDASFAKLPDSCLLYTSPSPRDRTRSRMPSSA